VPAVNLTDPLDQTPQDHPLSALGWDPRWAQATAERPGRPARVVRVDRGGADVISPDGAERVHLAPGVLAAARQDPVSTPCVGDWVLINDLAAGAPVLTAVLPRRSAVVRAAVTPGTSHGQVLAANVDHVLVVEPAQPQPDLARVERLLALAWESGATPLVVLTKVDLAPDVDDWLVELTAAAPAVQVQGVSAVTGAGLGELAGRLAPRTTVVMLGPSGAGKSTLANALAGVAHMGTQELRADGRGRHTTVHRELLTLPSGVLLIDTPGLRSVGLVEAAGLDRVFSDIDDLARDCRFSDCGHTVEPGCAVLAALHRGDLSPRRLASWRKLEREAAWMAARQDVRLRQARAADWKRIAKARRRQEPR
jgi:ribosome biogenesis GTPase / thiamine phosphate phosphatase